MEGHFKPKAHNETLKKLGIVLNFWTIEIDIDEIILPMREIIELSTRAKWKGMDGE